MIVTIQKYYKHNQNFLLARYKKLQDENKRACNLMLLYNEDLRRAYRLKELFYALCQNPKHSIQRKEFRKWIQEAKRSGLKEFEKCVTPYRNWSKEILNAFKYEITNGTTEGFNNRI